MITQDTAMDAKIMNLMQFARKAGKLVSGTDACIRAIHRKKVYLILMTTDYSANSAKQILSAVNAQNLTVHMINRCKMKELSDALGLPLTGVFGIIDKGFAERIKGYDGATKAVEESCQYEYTS